MGIAKVIKARMVVSDHNNGVTVKQLAKKYEVTTTTIRNYIKEDKERKENKEAVKKKALDQKQKKEERDQERRSPIEARTARAIQRKEKIKADVEAGMSRQEAAEKEGLSYATVTDYIRGDKLPEAVETYRDMICTAVKKETIREWAKRQPGSTIDTPGGKMIVLEAYPNILECAKRCKRGFIVTTYTLGEVYYMNQGGKAWVG